MGRQDDDLSGLTEDERALLAEVDDSDASDDLPPDDDGEDDAGSSGNVATRSDEESARDTGGQDDEPAPKEQIRPLYEVDADVDAIEGKLKELAQAKRDARRKYEEGELSEDEYDAELDRIDTERDRANADRIRAQVSQEMTQQQLRDAYKGTVEGFLKDIKAAGFDYRDPKNAEAMKQLDATVKALASQPHEQNPEGWRQVFDDAHTLVAKRLKIQIEAAKPAGKKADPGKDRHPDLSQVPPTIGRGPAAGATTVEGDEFAHISSMSGIEAEKAVARLTPEQRARWEAQG